MNCLKALKHLPLYISDDLEGSELSAVEDHLNGCLNCYREYQSHLKALRDLKRLGEKPDLSTVMDGFTDEVMAQIAHDKGGPSAPVPRVIYAAFPYDRCGRCSGSGYNRLFPVPESRCNYTRE